MERLKNNPEPVFEPGMLVKLRDDLPPDVQANWENMLGKDKPHRVVYVGIIPGQPEYGEVVWIGPSDITQKNIEDFLPGMEEDRDPRYQNVFQIDPSNLRPMPN